MGEGAGPATSQGSASVRFALSGSSGGGVSQGSEGLVIPDDDDGVHSQGGPDSEPPVRSWGEVLPAEKVREVMRTIFYYCPNAVVGARSRF